MVDSDEGAHGVRELGTRLGVSPSTAHRLLGELEKLGMVSRTAPKRARTGRARHTVSRQPRRTHRRGQPTH
ncbi:helix-turn-helix domain-containing protein [Streptomyces sp. NPDC002896]|uniref:helix-turn-helix domain-containing protein n=1 Tax=Streptomyces sp. NPDC002896 TaxID=3154438 RepID=UPI003318D8A2